MFNDDNENGNLASAQTTGSPAGDTLQPPSLPPT